MDREKLIKEVKHLYAALASYDNQQHIIQSTANLSPDAYYEKILSMVIKEISAGRFDNFNSGQEIIDAVTKNKEKWLRDWNESS